MPWFVRTPDSKHHYPRCNADEKPKHRRKPCNANNDMRWKNKSEAKNPGKAGDARRKTENRDLAICMGAKACIGNDKVRKTTTKIGSTLKIVCSKL